MAPTATGSKARLAPQARRKACKCWSWAAACGVQGGAYRGGRPPTACLGSLYRAAEVIRFSCAHCCTSDSVNVLSTLLLQPTPRSSVSVRRPCIVTCYGQWRRREGFCRPRQRSMVPPLQPTTPVISALDILKININLQYMLYKRQNSKFLHSNAAPCKVRPDRPPSFPPPLGTAPYKLSYYYYYYFYHY